MKLTPLRSAILFSLLPTTSVFAAGLDRSGQSISAFLQPGNYAEAGISVLDPTVEGTADAKLGGGSLSDMGDDYYFPAAAVKVQATDKISLGLLYDQPFGADATYGIDSGVFDNSSEGTKVKVRTNNLTALVGYQPTENWNIYAGPVWQTVKADISLRGGAYSLLSGYDIHVKQKDAYGWAAGFAYQIPEIALKAAVTYRSEIKHKTNATETSNLAALGASIPATGHPFSPYKPFLSTLGYKESTLDATTPQSVNIDLQTGIAANTLAFANLRWVQWDQFAVKPTLLAQASAFAKGKAQNLIDYTDDQYSITTGLSRKFNEKWAGTAAIGWDSGAGNPVTTLGPTEGYWSVGLGGQYSPAENYFIQAGVKYFWLGDAEAQTGGDVKASFEGNTAIAYGMKIGYKF